jgi:hypothetical protein
MFHCRACEKTVDCEKLSQVIQHLNVNIRKENIKIKSRNVLLFKNYLVNILIIVFSQCFFGL